MCVVRASMSVRLCVCMCMCVLLLAELQNPWWGPIVAHFLQKVNRRERGKRQSQNWWLVAKRMFFGYRNNSDNKKKYIYIYRMYIYRDSQRSPVKLKQSTSDIQTSDILLLQ